MYVPGARDQRKVEVCKVPNNTKIINWTCSRSTEINWTDLPLIEGWYDNLTYFELILAFNLTKFEYA